MSKVTISTKWMRNGFTLIELIVVVILLVMIFFLGIEGFKALKPQPKALTPLNLKDTIKSTEMFQGEATMVCIERCQKCYLRSALGASFVPYQHKIDLKNITAYTVDENDDIVEIEYGRFKDSQICLAIEFYSNGSSTPLIVSNEKGVYYLPSFFGKAQRFESLDEAKEQWIAYEDALRDSGNYY